MRGDYVVIALGFVCIPLIFIFAGWMTGNYKKCEKCGSRLTFWSRSSVFHPCPEKRTCHKCGDVYPPEVSEEKKGFLFEDENVTITLNERGGLEFRHKKNRSHFVVTASHNSIRAQCSDPTLRRETQNTSLVAFLDVSSYS